MRTSLMLGASFATLALAAPCVAETPAAPPAPATPSTTVASVVVTAQPGSLSQPGLAQQRAEVLSTAGSVGFIDAEDLKGRYALTLRDVLKDQPGVFVQNRYGQEIRLSVRGSGIGRGFHLRGIELLQDGIPWNLADGSGDFYEVDPLSLRSIEVYKGGNGLQFGSSTLGGAINLVTPTARTAAAPTVLRLEGGSFSTARTSATVSGVRGDLDGLLTVTGNTSTGSRQHSRSNDLFLNANLGWRIREGVENRTWLHVSDTRQELPGSVTLASALDFPDRAAPASANPVAGGNQQRNQANQRISNRTSFQVGTGRVDVDLFAYHKHLYHPIFQVVHQDGWTWGGDVRYTSAFDVAGLRNELVAGAGVKAGFNHAKQFLNLAGARQNDVTTANAHQKAANTEAWAEDRLYVTPTVALTAGAKLIADRRDLDNIAAPARSGDKTFYGLSPKVGVLWRPTPAVQVFADVTRSRDVPDFTDLAQTNTAGVSFVPLRQQKAWTYEVGARGEAGPVRFDVTLYRAEITGELLQFLTDPNIPAATFNAGDTVHQGVEASATLDVLRAVGRANGEQGLTLTGLWNLNDFTFDGDRQYRDNRIAGTPLHVLRFAARYTRARLLGLANAYLSPQVDWVPEGAWADQANTLRVPGYALFGIEAGVDLRPGLTAYVEGRNLTDESYVSDIGPVTNLALPATSKTIFYPGDRRSVFAGVRLAF